MYTYISVYDKYTNQSETYGCIYIYFGNYKICFSEHYYWFFREEQTISANRNITFIMCSDKVSYLFLFSIALLMVLRETSRTFIIIKFPFFCSSFFSVFLNIFYLFFPRNFMCKVFLRRNLAKLLLECRQPKSFGENGKKNLKRFLMPTFYPFFFRKSLTTMI